MRRLYALALAGSLALPACAGEAAVLLVPPEMEMEMETTASENAEPLLLFSDDFDGEGLDADKWAVAPPWDRQGRSTWDGGMVSVRDGLLRLGFARDAALGAAKTDDTNAAKNWLRAGAVRTMTADYSRVMFENNYGWYEARIKLPQVQGMWGAFWLMSPTLADGAAPEVGTEIDIVESIHNERGAYNAAIHWGGYGDGHQSKSSEAAPLPVDIYDGEFHVFALAWSPGAYVFYVDGTEFWRVTGNINQNPNYIKLSVEGAEWAGDLPQDFTEGEMLVDYVRVYAQPNG